MVKSEMRKEPESRKYSCGLEAALEVVGGKWKVLILWPLRAEPHRFGELRRQISGISEKMLIQHLKEMEADGIVTRTDYKEVPPRVDYALTAFGHSLCDALAPLCAWGQQHMERIEACYQEHEARRVKACA
jgi:DNA-binding HxlR family transcriptional regulator